MLPIQPGIPQQKLPERSMSLLRHNMKQKKYKLISKTQIVAFLVLLFVFSANTAGANTGSLPTQAGLPIRQADLDSSAQNTAKVCKDVSCINPPPGVIDFKIGKSPLTIDSVSGIKGMVFGNELGNITMNSVHFKDPQTGLLSGTASYNDGSISGLINFSVTGQKVVIDPKTGEWKGWAFASGPKGGWIKFDCQDPASCVRTTWRGEEKAKINLSAAVINATPASTIRISDLTSAYQSYLSPVAVPPVTFLPTIILPTTLIQPPVSSLSGGTTSAPAKGRIQEGSVSDSTLASALTKLLNKKEIADKLRGPQGATGPQGPAGIAAPIGSSAMSVSQPARSITPSAPTANPVVFLPVGITMPNPSMNFSGGAYASIANLTSNLFTNTTSNITTLNVAGSTVLSGSLNVTGVATIPTLTTTTGAIDVLTVGGGYGCTGLTVSNTGNIQANGTLTIDGTSTLTGATTITGTITNSALTASRLVFTDASKVLTSTGDSAAVSNAVSDETGTGVLVLGTSPTFITSITSPLVIGGTATTSDLTLQTTSGVGTTGADMHFLTGSNGATEAMTILNSGNVGIGTTAPGAKLDVSGLTRIYDQTAVTGVSTLTIRAGAGQATGPSHLFDIFANDGTTARFHVTDTGNVGIGTTGPANKLQVVHTSAGAETVPLLLQNNDATDGTAVSLGFSPYTGTITSKIMSSHDGTANYSLRFYNWDADTLLTERMRISNTGNVGIGTTEPTSSLQVSKSQATNTTIAVDNLDVANDGVIAQSLVSASASNIYTRAYGPANTTSRWGLTVGSYSELANTIGNGIIIGTRVVSPIIFGINSSEKMRIDTAGNVGIGTTAPATVLHMVDSGGDALRGFLIDSANAGNAGPIVIGRKARGSISSPTAVTADDALLVLSGLGYGATGYSSGGRANIRLVATETWTDTAQGTYASFYTTPTGTATAAEVMRINGAGNVGIGITNPSTLLHLKGTASLARVMFQEYGGNQTAQIGMSAASTGRLGIFGDVGGELVSVCTSAVSCTAIGNLGLGTTNPTSLLELGTNEGDLTFSGTGNHDITASAGTLRLGAVTATGAITAASSPLNIGSSGVRFGTIYADSVDATNLVGGVVTGSTTSADWTINSDNATADTEDMTVTFERGTASPNAVLKWTSASDQFDFNFGGSFSGNVGIGTTAPTHPLHIYRAGSTTLEVDSDATWDTWTYYSQADVLKAAVGYRNSNAGLTFYESDADRMIVKTGNLGIGTTAPTANLQVAQGTAGVGTVSNLAGGTTVTGVGTQFLNTFKVGDTITINAETVAISAIASDTSMTTAAITGANSGVAYTLVGGTRFSVLGNGNVGIGTTTPLALADFRKNTDTSTTWWTDAVSGLNVQNDHATGDAILKLKGITTGIGRIVYGVAGATDKLIFSSRESAGTTAESVTFDNNGNVGIGTTSPGYKLDIADATANGRGINVTQTATSGTVYGISANATGAATQNIGGYFNATGATTNQALYLNAAAGANNWNVYAPGTAQNYFAGNVGIGTTGPSGLLHISKLAGDNPIYIDRYSSNNGHVPTLQFRTSQQNTVGNTATTILNQYGRLEWYGNDGNGFQRAAYIQAQQASSGSTDADLTFSAGASGLMFMDGSTGNVGIGTTNPGTLLHIESLSPVFTIHDNDADVETVGQILGTINFDTVDGSLTGGTAAYIKAVSGESVFGDRAALTFGTALNGVAVAEKMRITESGNVGIGTTDPNAKLEVATSNAKSATEFWSTSIFDTTSAAAGVGGGIQFNGYKTAQSSGGLFAAIDGQKESATAGEEKGKLSLWTNDGTQLQKRLTIDSTGNVGIGTTGPLTLTHIRGANANSLGNIAPALLTLESTTAAAVDVGPAITFGGASGNAITPYAFGKIMGAKESATAADYSGYLSLWSVSSVGSPTEQMRILGNGNVGIGTTDPGTAKLQVRSDTGTDYDATTGTNNNALLLNNQTAGANNPVSLKFVTEANGEGSISLVENAGNTNGDFRFNLRNGGVRADVMTILSGGNVGIGTTTPSNLLNVYSSTADAVMEITSEAADGDPYINWEINASEWSMGIDDGESDNFQITNTANLASGELLTITGGGNVGIGTTDPSSTLHVQNAIGTQFQWTRTSQGSGTLGIDNITGVADVIIAPTVNGSGTVLQYRISAGSTVSGLTLDETGNVGIGTTAPGSKLEVSVTTGNNAIAITNSSAATNKTWIAYPVTNGVSTDLKFYDTADRVTFQAGGNVGIGTTGPAGMLHILHPAANSDTNLYVENNTGSGAGGGARLILDRGWDPREAEIQFQTAGTTNWYAGILRKGGSGTGSFAISNASDMLVTTPEFLIADGIVGINMSDPSVALDVTGDIEYTGTITDVSDVRLKENITDFNGALGIVSSLQAKTYNMIGDPESEVGFIAQDVQALFPGATSTIDPTNGYLGVSYVSLIPIISQAVKEMNLNLEGIAGTTTPLPGSASESFATAFFTNLKTTLSAWLADAGNGITNILAGTITAKNELCIGTTCVTEAQLQTLLANANGSIVNNTGSGTTTTSTTPAATCSDGIQNQDETGIDTGGVCAASDTSSTDSGLDSTAPVITLTGEITINLNVGDTYTEQGATATDNIDTSVAVIISGSVDTATAGTYTIHYNASDTAGNPAVEVTRTINVAAAP